MANLENTNSSDIAVTQLQSAVDAMRQELQNSIGENSTALEAKIGESYSPAASSDWAGDPATIAEALDRLAAAVAIATAAPVP